MGSKFIKFAVFIYLFGVLRRFQHCTGHITTGSWKGRENQYMEFVRVLFCKLPTNGKQLPAFPLEAMPGTEPRPQRWEARVKICCKTVNNNDRIWMQNRTPNRILKTNEYKKNLKVHSTCNICNKKVANISHFLINTIILETAKGYIFKISRSNGILSLKEFCTYDLCKQNRASKMKFKHAQFVKIR